jgi:hypothetical protein
MSNAELFFTLLPFILLFFLFFVTVKTSSDHHISELNERQKRDAQEKEKLEQERVEKIDRERLIAEESILKKERLKKENLEKERIEVENAKKTLTVLEAAEIARTALKKLRISDLKELIPFVQTEEQLNEMISDFHNELLPVYEELMISYGIKKNLVGNKRFSELLEYCLEFGKTAIRKIPEITLEHKPLDERSLKSELVTKEREIKKVASWAEIKKKIDSEK